MAATTAGEDRVLAAAQQIVQSLNTPKEIRDDMLLILSSFDNRLSNITNLVKDETNAADARLDAAEKIILRWDTSTSDSSRHHPLPWEDGKDEVNEYISAIDGLLELIDDSSIRFESEIMDRAHSTIQIAMSRMEEEFRHILITNTVPLDAERLHGSIRRGTQLLTGFDDEFESFTEADGERNCFHERGLSLGDDLCVELINAGALIDLNDISDRMIRAGYEKECVQVYTNVRRDTMDECLAFLGVEKLSIEEVQKIEWKDLDEKMKKWIQAAKITVRVLLSGEERICDQIFNGSESIKEICLNEVAKGCLMPLLNFGEAVAIGNRSSEKLFRILEMYDALADALPELEDMVTDDYILIEARGVLSGLGEAAKGTLVELQNAVKNEPSRRPMQNGEIHPATRYMMNYLKLLVDYGNTLNSILETDEDEADRIRGKAGDNLQLQSTTPFAKRLFLLISALESNLEEKSKVYEDNALQYIFLMNNILYVVQKVKGSELGSLLGDNWVRKRRGQVRQYATSYLRATWSKALSCLKDEGIGSSSSNASKVALKERFKSFNACFEEVYRIQTAWKVPDPQLREELRISISEKVLPAYRSFVGRFGSQLESGRHAGKYIKYTPDDLESYLLDLFEGSPLVLQNTRKKSSS